MSFTRTIRILICVSLLSIAHFFLPLFAYNGEDLLKALVWSWNEISNTVVRYKNITEWNDNYTLIQHAIDAWYLKNRSININLKKKFTSRSLKNFVSLYIGTKLPLHTNTPVNENIWEDSLSMIRNGYIPQKSLPQTIEDAQSELVHLLQQNKSSDKKRIQELITFLKDDPYAEYYTGINATDFKNTIEGDYVGIGIALEQKNNGIIISSVYDGPAKNAGIQIWDKILYVNTTRVDRTLTLSDIRDLIQWPEGSTVTITLLRSHQTYTYTLTRRAIQIDPITISHPQSDTTLLKIDIFNTSIYKSFTKKLPDIIWSQNLIIDLRNNPGGELEETAKMLDHIVPKGLPTYHIQDTTNNKIIETRISQGKQSLVSLSTPTYILLNHNSASASEIFAGVFREYYPNSILIGTQSYGKWTVQSVWTTPDGEYVKFTTGKWLLGKSQQSIDGKWLQPDIVLSDNPITVQDEVIDYILWFIKR